LVGVAICGRPTGRFLDDGETIEVYRNCVKEGNKNACSMLYGAAIRTAKAKGFRSVVTFTLMSEPGSSTKAANFYLEAENVGSDKGWTGKRKYKCKSQELKKRWRYWIRENYTDLPDDYFKLKIMITKERVAKLLDQREYRNELDKAEEEEIKYAELVVVFGASDDLLEFRGVVHDEIGAWDGVLAQLFKKDKQWEVLDDDSFQEEIGKISEYGIDLKGHEIEAVWSPEEPDCSWLIKTEIPHATFDIMEDGDLYCRGIVFSINDLK